VRVRTLPFLLLALVVALPAAADDPFLRRTTTVRVVEREGPAVVSITTEQDIQYRPFPNPIFDQFFRDFFEPRMPRTQQNLGSGVLIDADRHVLTNEHVVVGASRIRVSLPDGRNFDATLVGADPNNDLAVLQVETKDKLPWIPPGSSGDLMVGEPVIAIGNPFGLSSTVTTGVISATNRSIRTENRVYHGFIQTDASINPGNSGGPLLNAEGALIGVNSAVYQGAQGIGFAIPIDVAKRVVSELIAHGEVSPVWLGVSFQDLSPELVSVLGLPPDTGGALVNKVHEGSPADRAGLKRGDVVTHVDGQRIEGAQGFFERLETATTGQVLELTLSRGGHTQVLPVKAEEVPRKVVFELALEMTGLELEPRKGGGYAVRSVRAGSGSARVGLQAGDLVLGINGQALDDENALRRSVLALRGQAQALLVVQRGPGRYHVAIPLV
jgi:Do/DeqQ family serine protease